MSFEFKTPQEDIDRMLALEKLVRAHGGDEWKRYLEFMGMLPMSTRVEFPRPLDGDGRDVRDGCIISGAYSRAIQDMELKRKVRALWGDAREQVAPPRRRRSPSTLAAAKREAMRELGRCEKEMARLAERLRTRIRAQCVALLNIAQRKLRAPIELVGCNGSSWLREAGNIRWNAPDRYRDLNDAVSLKMEDSRYCRRFPELVFLHELIVKADELPGSLDPVDARPTVKPMKKRVS